MVVVHVRGLAEDEVFRLSSTLNSNNHHSYAPFRYVENRKVLFYHEEQYSVLFLPWGKELLAKILSTFQYTLYLLPDNEWKDLWQDIPVGEIIPDTITSCIPLLAEGDTFGPLSLENELFCHIYKLYAAQWNYNHWIEQLRPTFAQQPVIRIFTEEEIILLERITEERMEQAHPFTNEYLKEFANTSSLLQDLAEGIKQLKILNEDFFKTLPVKESSKFEYRENEEDYSFMEMLTNEEPEENSNGGIPVLDYPHDIDMFVKLCSSSAKNEIRPKPLNTVQDIIEFITGRNQFLQKDYRHYKKYNVLKLPVGIIMMPWNNVINAKSEFRVFIRNRQLIAISQQTWYKLFYYSSEEIEIIAKSISELFYTTVQSLLPLPSAILDITVNFDTGNAYLIEINPWGTWATSGSALFDWVKDHDIIEPNLHASQQMETTEVIYLRILHKMPFENTFQLSK